MASLGLLFLLLVMCPLLVFTANPPPSKKKDVLNFFKENIDSIKDVTTPLFDLMEKNGPIASAVVNLLFLIVQGEIKEDKVLQTVVDQFQSLNFKLDQYHVQQRWDIWAAAAYHKPEMDIEVAWTSFTTLLKSSIELRDAETRKKHANEFLTSYQKYEPAGTLLHRYLVPKGTSFINNLGPLLADHVKCDENDITLFTALIANLLFKATILNTFYYSRKQLLTQARIDQWTHMQYDFTSAMYQLRKHCSSQMMDYVKQEVEALIDEKQDRNDLAKKIREALEKKDGKKQYDWMVVAFKTKKSDHNIIKIRNKHTLTGFTVEKKGKVSVAVARQLRGKYTMASEVKKAIETCLGQKKLIEKPCYKVNEMLRDCQEKVGGVSLSQTYTAVHAFHGSAHESHTQDTSSDAISVYENTDDEISSQPDKDNIYKGECWLFQLLYKKRFRGNFHVLIKSDEEIENNPCKTLKCGGEDHGQCESVSSVAMCECKYPYYGENCEKDINDFKKNVNNLPSWDNLI